MDSGSATLRLFALTEIMAHYYNPITGKVETVNAAKKKAVDEYYNRKTKLSVFRNPLLIVGVLAGVGFLGLKLKDLWTLVKVETSEAADKVIETVIDPFQITGYEEKAKFLRDWNACGVKYPKGSWFRTARMSACMIGKGYTSEAIGEGLEAALKKL